jgi:hypothetical protein
VIYFGAPSLAGNPRIEAAMAFDRALSRHIWALRGRRLRGLHDTRELPRLENAIPRWRWAQDVVREQTILVGEVVGTSGSGVHHFDADFLPTTKLARGRFASLFAAFYRGDPIPPVDVYRWNGGYYVQDGHHRVAAALAVGREFLEANVIEVRDPGPPAPAPEASVARPPRTPIGLRRVDASNSGGEGWLDEVHS